MNCPPKLRAFQAVATVVMVGACAALFGTRSLPAQDSSPGIESTRTEVGRNVVVGPARRARPQHDPDAGYAATLALVDRVMTLQGDLQLAQAELAEAERLGVTRASALTPMRLSVATLERRLDAALILVQSEIEATQIELAGIQHLLDSPGFTAVESPRVAGWEMQQVRLAARLKVLQTVL